MDTFDLKDFLLRSETTLCRLKSKILEDQKFKLWKSGLNLDDNEDLKELLVEVWENGYIPYLLQGTVASCQSEAVTLECTAQNYALLSYLLPPIFTLSVTDIVDGGNVIKVLVSVNSSEVKYMGARWADYQFKFFEIYRKVMMLLLHTASHCETVNSQDLSCVSVEDICLQLARYCMSKITKGTDNLILVSMPKKCFNSLFSDLSDFISCEECNEDTYIYLEVGVHLR